MSFILIWLCLGAFGFLTKYIHRYGLISPLTAIRGEDKKGIIKERDLSFILALFFLCLIGGIISLIAVCATILDLDER